MRPCGCTTKAHPKKYGHSATAKKVPLEGRPRPPSNVFYCNSGNEGNSHHGWGSSSQGKCASARIAQNEGQDGAQNPRKRAHSSKEKRARIPSRFSDAKRGHAAICQPAHWPLVAGLCDGGFLFRQDSATPRPLSKWSRKVRLTRPAVLLMFYKGARSLPRANLTSEWTANSNPFGLGAHPWLGYVLHPMFKRHK
jgi:hypothetical protein